MEEKQNKKQKKQTSTLSKLVTAVQSGIGKLYKNTYLTNPDNYSDLEMIKTNIDNSIDNIISNNINSVGIPNISKLYSRIQLKGDNTTKDDKMITTELENLFNDPSVTDGILSTYAQNKYIKDLDEEIDLICKYMPQLEDALDAKKDNVLAADHFSKDFVNAINKTDLNDDSSFQQRIETLKETYNLLELFEDIYDKTAHYGEQFIYIIPYNKALNTIMNARNTGYNASVVTQEAAGLSTNGKIKLCIDTTQGKESKIVTEGVKDFIPLETDINIGKLNVELDTTGILESALNEYSAIQNVYKRKKENNNYNNSGFEGSEATEGIISAKKDNTKINAPGCIIKKLRRENVIPLYIDELCLGYYYFEYENDDIFTQSSSMSDPMMALKAGKFNVTEDNMKKEQMMRFISSKLSNFIDSKFINANQDLRKEIYMILKHNNLFNVDMQNQLKISFIPPEDMVHMYFQKDTKTNRGISDLDKSLLPAKLYTSLYVTNTIGILTRGQDKRVYYVRQNIDSNISQTLLNTINQIKKSNFGARELASVKNILNITGRYNDYVIPTGPTGDSPIQFEIMQGQNIDPKTELMNILEQMAINGTDVPYEYIQARQTVDYAVRLTMSNGKFLRKVFKRQAVVERFFSRILTMIYNSEFQTNEEIKVSLPPPAFLNITNTNQMIQNTNDYVENIVEMEAGGEAEEVKALFRQKLKRYYLSTYLDLKTINELKQKAIMEKKVKDSKASEDSSY
jgi:hypothetical protein